MEIPNLLDDFDSDNFTQSVVAHRVSSNIQALETVYHRHEKGQLVMPLTGCVTCTIDDAIWMVPTNCAVWIPSQIAHSNLITSNTDVCMLFVDPAVKDIPTQSCTIAASPLLRETIIRLAASDQDYQPESRTARLVSVLIDELVSMPKEHYDFPIPSEPRLNRIAQAMLAKPHERHCVDYWAKRYAMSERTLTRLIKQELGISFSHWRRQLDIVLSLKKLSADTPVQRIAEDLGYESVSAYIHFFKKNLGLPPKQYIKQHFSH